MVSKVSKDSLELHLKHVFEHHVNFAQRVVRLNQEITDESFDLIDSAMTELESHNGMPITIRINSTGGDEYAAQAIVGRMKRSKCRVITEGFGSIMSAATLIFAAGDHRRISQYADFMWHESSYEVNDKHENIKSTVAHYQRMDANWAKWMEELSKKPAKFYSRQAKYTDKYWTPEQLIEFGIADEII